MSIHIATSADLGRVVRRGIRESVGFVADNWLVGPCGLDPQLHSTVRSEYGVHGSERTRWLKSFRLVMDAIDSPERVVVWMSRLGSDTVALWAFCAWRLLRWPNEPNLGLVVLGGPNEEEDPAGVGGGFIRTTPAEARRGLETERSLALTQVREMALLWQILSGDSPILSSGGARAARAHKGAFELGRYQMDFFPRLSNGKVLLSRFDELLFSCLEDKWMTPAEVIVSRGKAGDELRKRLRFTGDVFFSTRLAQWAAHNGDHAAFRSEPYQVDNTMNSARYRLSDVGLEMKQTGLREIANGAPLQVWGATAYDPLTRWVAVDDHEECQRLRQSDDGFPVQE